MRKISEPTGGEHLPAYSIDTEEAAALAEAISVYLQTGQDDTLVDPEGEEKYQAGLAYAEEEIVLLGCGKRILSTEADFYLAGIALKRYVNLFDASIRLRREQILRFGLGQFSGERQDHAMARQIGTTPERFVENAILASQMLSHIPAYLQIS